MRKNAALATALTALALFACGHATGAVVNAALNTGVAVAAAGASRASGGCYASCPVGTTCNAKSGLCEELPCRGQCRADEYCDTAQAVPTCVSTAMAPLRIETTPSSGRIDPQ